MAAALFGHEYFGGLSGEVKGTLGVGVHQAVDGLNDYLILQTVHTINLPVIHQTEQ